MSRREPASGRLRSPSWMPILALWCLAAASIAGILARSLPLFLLGNLPTLGFFLVMMIRARRAGKSARG